MQYSPEATMATADAAMRERNAYINGLIAAGKLPILGFEAPVLQLEFVGLAAEQKNLGVLLGQAMQDTSETWHDNAAADQINHRSIGLAAKASTTTDRIRRGQIIDYPASPSTIVTLGSVVEVFYERFGDTETVCLTGAVREADDQPVIPEGCSLATLSSPLGTALYNSQSGDKLTIPAPRDRPAIAIEITRVFNNILSGRDAS